MKKSILNWANMAGANCVVVTISAVILLFTATNPASGDILINGSPISGTDYTIQSDESVDTAKVGGNSTYYYDLYNYGKVGEATTLNSRGTFTNNSGGTVDTATLNGGTFTNNSGGTVDTTTLNGGTFTNNSGGTVNTTTVNGGTFNNNFSSIVNTATVNEWGWFDNDGTINNLTLLSGSYFGDGYTENLYVGNGGGFSTFLYGGTIGNLSFGDGGQLNIGNRNNSASKVNADGKVDLTNAAIRLNFLVYSAIEPDFSIDLETLFNFTGDGGFAEENNWWEGIKSVELLRGNYLVGLYSHGGGVFGLQELPPPDSSTPEPATMLIFGLGLAGLGLARRRMGK